VSHVHLDRYADRNQRDFGGLVGRACHEAACEDRRDEKLARLSTQQELKMNHSQIVSQADWIVARKALLAKEKEATRQRDALSAERRKLPMVRIEKDYVFEGPQGATSLRDLFDGRPQLIAYHFMFDPSWDEGCKSCSHLIDNIAGSIVHLGARDTSFAVISLAPFAKIEAFKLRMGWTFPWLSSAANDFNNDFQVSIDAAEGSSEYNYTSTAALLQAGKIWFPKGEMPGLSVFLLDGDSLYHTYSAYQRGLDLLLNTYNFLDLTPLGRHEEAVPGQSWIRHHDKYPA
jgi:predicted dithiol-disulfide oxidoreductase (DUF899 family)